MTICARFDGRRIEDCTRGEEGCICAKERATSAALYLAVKEAAFARLAYDQLVARMDQEIERAKANKFSNCFCAGCGHPYDQPSGVACCDVNFSKTLTSWQLVARMKTAEARYEKIQRLSVKQIRDLYLEAVTAPYPKNFDDLVDKIQEPGNDKSL